MNLQIHQGTYSGASVSEGICEALDGEVYTTLVGDLCGVPDASACKALIWAGVCSGSAFGDSRGVWLRRLVPRRQREASVGHDIHALHQTSDALNPE